MVEDEDPTIQTRKVQDGIEGYSVRYHGDGSYKDNMEEQNLLRPYHPPLSNTKKFIPVWWSPLLCINKRLKTVTIISLLEILI